MKRTIILNRLGSLLFVASLALTTVNADETQYEKKEREASEDKLRRIQEQLTQKDTAIRFYGKVLDQNGQSVADAVVNVSAPVRVGYMKEMQRKCQIRSDAQGRFEVTEKLFGLGLLKGSDLFITGITRDGYEAGGDSHAAFTYREDYLDRHMPNKDQPVIFHMRKTGAPVFLIKEMYLKLAIGITASGRAVGYDFIKRYRLDDTHELIFNGESVFPDIQIKAKFNRNNAAWMVRLSSGNTNGGIIVSDQLLYEAPETGYQLEYSFTPEDRPQRVKMPYIYLKSREPAIYTRIEIERSSFDNDVVRLSGKSVTNPYGDRNLEEVKDIPYTVAKQLTDEVKTAFRQNKRPTKPDISILVIEAKAKAGKVN